MSDAAALGAGGSARDRALDWLSQNPALACLGVAVAASGAIQIALGSHLIFLGDDWRIVLDRHGFSVGTFLDSHQGHLIVSLVVIYKLLLAGFGMSSPVPFHVVSTLIYLLAAVLLFAYARRRVGDWLALLGAVVILFFGASEVDMLSPFQIFFSGSIAAGLGALLALDREDRLGDAIACAALVLSISFGEVGIPFALGALVRLALADRPLAGRLYVVLVPLILYALWWLGWGHAGPSYLTLQNVGTTPRYVLDASATAIGALVGITSAAEQQPEAVGQLWAPVLLVATVGLAVWRVRRIGGMPPGLWAVLAIGVAFWTLAGFNANAFRLPDNSRYLYPGAVLILLIASELLNGVRLGNRALAAVAAVAAISVAANLAFLSDAYRLFTKPTSQRAQIDLRALEIAAPVKPSFFLNAGFLAMDARSYLSAVVAWGSPAYTDAELLALPERQRVTADQVLGSILGPRLEPAGSASGGSCGVVQASGSGATGVELVAGRITMRAPAGTDAKVELGRFSDELPITVGSLQSGSSASLRIPADGSDRPWTLGLVGNGPVTVCGSGTGQRPAAQNESGA